MTLETTLGVDLTWSLETDFYHPLPPSPMAQVTISYFGGTKFFQLQGKKVGWIRRMGLSMDSNRLTNKEWQKIDCSIGTSTTITLSLLEPNMCPVTQGIWWGPQSYPFYHQVPCYTVLISNHHVATDPRQGILLQFYLWSSCVRMHVYMHTDMNTHTHTARLFQLKRGNTASHSIAKEMLGFKLCTFQNIWTSTKK